MSGKKSKSDVAGAAKGGGRRQGGGTDQYWVVNPSGAIHDVSREQATSLLRLPGWRQATGDEVAELRRRGGHQTADDPICPPWNPEPLAVELDPAAEV